MGRSIPTSLLRYSETPYTNTRAITLESDEPLIRVICVEWTEWIGLASEWESNCGIVRWLLLYCTAIQKKNPTACAVMCADHRWECWKIAWRQHECLSSFSHNKYKWNASHGETWCYVHCTLYTPIKFASNTSAADATNSCILCYPLMALITDIAVH